MKIKKQKGNGGQMGNKCVVWLLPCVMHLVLQPLGTAQLRIHLSRGAHWLYKQRTMTTTFQPDTRAVPSSSGWEGLHLEQDLP